MIIPNGLDIEFPEVPLEQLAEAFLEFASFEKICFPDDYTIIRKHDLKNYHSIIFGDAVILRRACAKLKIDSRIYLPYDYSHCSGGVVVRCLDVQKLKNYFEI